MAVERDLPYGSFHFDVRIGDRRRRAASGFSAVILPTMPVQTGHADEPAALLVLRRGFTGALDLYEWWKQATEPRRSRGRVVAVELLDEQRREPVTTWRFTNCRPVSLDYSPLDALGSDVLIETIALSFDAVEMS